ncbi:MAG: hypothetical protein IJS71_02810 [Clostridia bacterium]|nr:hypothetical protein [Oscillospiraceae bacterium]MBQ7444856.1 hypothetical protein [Clostridia bacterium]
MSERKLQGDPVVQVTVTGSKTFQVVRITLSDAEECNVEIDVRNLLFGADANEGSLNNIYSADGVCRITDMCSDPILSENIEEPEIEVAEESTNSIDLRIFNRGKDLFFSYRNLASAVPEFDMMPKAKRIYEIVSEILRIASDLSGKKYSLSTMA